jgi:Cu2+-exporting ATPase
VNLGRSTICVEWLAANTALSQIADRIAALGYTVRPMGSLASREEWRRQDRAWLVHIGVAGAIAANVMAIAFALYGAQLAWMEESMRTFLQWISVGLAGLAVLWPGGLFLRNALAAIRTRTPHMDLPIALALLAGLGGGAAATAYGREGVYFESVSMLVFLLLVGRFVQFRQQRRARHDIELLCALVPQTARRVTSGGGMEEIPLDALNVGDRVQVPAGEPLPADGTLCHHSGHVDLQLLTGESRAVRVQQGDAVLAGSRAVHAPLEFMVTATGESTRAAAIVRMVEEAAGRRPQIVEFANRIAGWFVLAVVVSTGLVALAWWFIDPLRIPSIVVAMLVVTCPCALGLATPLTMVAGLAKAARQGILIRGGDVLERLSRAGTVVLDKTGTVTDGSMQVVGVWGDLDACMAAARLEQSSAHPVAQAILRWARTRGHVPNSGCVDVTGVHEVAGAGISGVVNGHHMVVGSARMLARCGLALGELPAAVHTMVEQNQSPVLVVVDGALAAAIAVEDPIRPDAPMLVKQLKQRGWRVLLASGDLDSLASRVGRWIGLDQHDVYGGCAPEDKVRLVTGQTARPVVMVGDGVNDLPAMSAADVGIAVRQGAQATVAMADVALTGGGLAQVAALMDGARRTMRTIHINFAISLAYNLIGGTLAATGNITPLMAAILMPLSGLTVTAVALRLPRFAPAHAAHSEDVCR